MTTWGRAVRPAGRRLHQANGVPLSVRIAAGGAEVAESALEHGEGEFRLGRLEALAGEQVAGAIIGDGERVAVLPVAEQELALVIGTPESVGRMSGGQRRAAGLVVPALTTLYESVAIERGVDRTHRGGGIIGYSRISLSRIFGAPQDGNSFLSPRIARSTWNGSLLACR